MTDMSEVFISYSSRDNEWVNRLARSLLERGLRVWRDSGNIRPGDRFPDALGVGLDSCDAVALVVSAHSVKSEWVSWELSRVRSRRPGTRVIPVRIDDTPIPDELDETHMVDFRDPERYEVQVDRLVWAGVRGTPLVCLVLHGMGAMPWPALDRWMRLAEVPVYAADYVELGQMTVHDLAQKGYRLICVIDPFEDWPQEGIRFRSPAVYVDEMFKIRESTRGTPFEVPFVLYSHPDALAQAKHGLSSDVCVRLSHYYSIHKYAADGRWQQDLTEPEFATLSAGARTAWTMAQRHLSNCIERARRTHG
jgi:hypothetical protein